MNMRFEFDHLSREEREAIEQLLLEEMERQQWGSIRYSIILNEEIVLTLQ
jgi:hypothetical protein